MLRHSRESEAISLRLEREGKGVVVVVWLLKERSGVVVS